MQVASTIESEIRINLETLVDIINGLADDEFDLRSTLVARGFSRAASASRASVGRLESRMREIDLFASLPDIADDEAIALTNEHLVELPITPSIATHDGVGPHLHWTSSAATFDDQVLADLLMSLANELCDNGTIRFGRCAARDCTDLFYDGTRNRSKKFCADPRCASRTHTADHRARQREG